MNNHESESLRINLDLAVTVNSTVLLHAYIWQFSMNSHLLWSSLQQPNFLFISLWAALFPFVLLRACMQNSSERCSCTSHDKSSEYMYIRRTSTHRDCEVPVWFSQVAITPSDSVLLWGQGGGDGGRVDNEKKMKMHACGCRQRRYLCSFHKQWVWSNAKINI